jgi:hypothetical protein
MTSPKESPKSTPKDPEVEVRYDGPSGTFDYHGTIFRIGEETTLKASLYEEIHAGYGADHHFMVVYRAATEPEAPIEVPPDKPQPEALKAHQSGATPSS